MINKVSDAYKKNLFYLIVGPLLKQIEAIFDLLIPLFMKAIIDLSFSSSRDVVTRSLGEFIKLFPLIAEDNLPLSYCFTGGMIILFMGIFGFITTMITQYLASLTACNVGTELRNSLYKKLMMLSKIERERLNVNHLLTVLNSDSYQVQRGVMFFIRLAIRAPLIVVGSLVISFILDWQIGLIFLGITPLIIIIIMCIMSKTSKMYLKIQGKVDDLSLKTTETVIGSKEIRAFNKKEKEDTVFENKAIEYQNSYLKVNRLNALVNPLTFAIVSVATVLVVILGSFAMEQGIMFNGSVLMPSTLLTEVAYLELIFQTVVVITNLVDIFTKASVSSKRCNEVLKIKPSIINSEYQKIKHIDQGEEIISFKNAYLSFVDGGNYALKNISFSLNKGESLGIIGATGSGKSTILQLILRFADATEGDVFYKGINIKDYSLNSLRSEIAYVPQKAVLFEGSIESNLKMSDKNCSDISIEQALKASCAYQFVKEYDDYLDHKVNEGGLNFSGGQRQRLTIARALVKKSEVLILDDSTSALDLLTDKKVRENIDDMYPDLTKIIVSQRVATISSSDKIIVIDKGEINAIGDHEYLLKNCPLYLETYLSQIRGDENE